MNAPFSSVYYKVHVITPTFIGAGKETSFALGEDYFYNDATGEYCFVFPRKFQRALSTSQLSAFSRALAGNDSEKAETLMKELVQKWPELVYHRSYCPFLNRIKGREVPFELINRHISDMDGRLILPGSSIKGALRSIIGTMLMRTNGIKRFDDQSLFGPINNNLMRFLQVGDVSLGNRGEVVPVKIFSGDLEESYAEFTHSTKGYGAWKHERIGGHREDFNEFGFVSAFQMAPEGSTGTLRLNWGSYLLQLIEKVRKDLLPKNAERFNEIQEHRWMSVAKKHTRDYLLKELEFFKAFPNKDFYDAEDIIRSLLHENDQEHSVVIRLGAGSGYHNITGDWQFKSHVFTGKSDRQDAIRFKTRKIAFTGDEKGPDNCYFPGFIKIVIDQ